MKLNKFLEVCGTLFGITGALGVCLLSIWGFYAWILGNTALIVYGFRTKQYSLVTLFSVYQAFTIFGIYNWISNGLL